MGLFKPALAELIGTFTLVFIGATAGATATSDVAGKVAVALAHGVALMTIVYVWGNASGAHVNPAVTLSLLLTGKISPLKAVVYWIVQFAGAAIAAYLMLYILGPDSSLGQTKGDLTADNALGTIIVEAVLTAFLVLSVFGTAVAGRGGNAAGIAIGFTLTSDILAGGSLTGGSMNPARTFGPALAAGDLSYLWMYIVGPAIGAAAAGLIYQLFFLDEAR